MNRIAGIEDLLLWAALAWIGLIWFVIHVGKKYQSNKTRIID